MNYQNNTSMMTRKDKYILTGIGFSLYCLTILILALSYTGCIHWPGIDQNESHTMKPDYWTNQVTK